MLWGDYLPGSIKRSEAQHGEKEWFGHGIALPQGPHKRGDYLGRLTEQNGEAE